MLNSNQIEINDLNQEAINSPHSLILESENFYTHQISEISKNLANNKNIKVVLLAGPSSAGKTTTSSLLKLNLGMLGINVVIVSLDDFFYPREQSPRLADGSYDFESIRAINLNKLNKFLDTLIKTGVSYKPKFNFITGMADPIEEEIRIDDNTIIIFEGLHALNPSLITHNADKAAKIFINLNLDYVINGKTILSAQDVRLIRRITRDYYNRNFNPLETIHLWRHVIEGEEKYIKPYKHLADFVIDSSHIYEPLLYATYSKKLISNAIKNPVNKMNKNIIAELLEKATELNDSLNQFEPLSKSLMPSTSLLWEFIGAAE